MAPPSPDLHNLDILAYAPRYNASVISEFAQAAKTRAPLATIVDFGAGMGTLTEHLGPMAREVIAVEPQLSYHSTLTSKCDRVLTSIAQVTTPVDAIFTSNVLEHIQYDQRALEELFEALKPGGLLFVYVPALPFLFSAMDRAVGHVRRYRKEELGRKLTAAGFAVEAVEFRDCIGVPASLWLKARGAAAAHPSRGAVGFYDRWLFPLSRRLDLAGMRRVVGKNLVAVAVRPKASHE